MRNHHISSAYPCISAQVELTEPEQNHGIDGELVDIATDPEAGATTAEYGIVMLAAVGFAGLLVVILKSDEVRQLLLGIVQNALSTGV